MINKLIINCLFLAGFWYISVFINEFIKYVLNNKSKYELTRETKIILIAEKLKDNDLILKMKDNNLTLQEKEYILTIYLQDLLKKYKQIYNKSYDSFTTDPVYTRLDQD